MGLRRLAGVPFGSPRSAVRVHSLAVYDVVRLIWPAARTEGVSGSARPGSPRRHCQRRPRAMLFGGDWMRPYGKQLVAGCGPMANSLWRFSAVQTLPSFAVVSRAWTFGARDTAVLCGTVLA